MKFIQKISDWKTWLFTILPITLLVSSLSIAIYLCVKSWYNAPILICLEALFTIAFLLMDGYAFVFEPIRQKHYIRGSAAIFLCCVFWFYRLLS